MSTATITDRTVETNVESNQLTEALEGRLSHPATSTDFDLKKGVNEVLADVGMTSDDCGGELSFYGQDPILPSPLRFGTMSAIGLAARSVAVAALWRQATGEGQNISVDVRKALRRFCGFFEGKWETVNGRPPSPGGYAVSPFLKTGDAFFRETRDGRYVVALDFYPQLFMRTLDFLRCSPSTESINNAILQWDPVELEQAAAVEGLVLAMVRTNEEFRREPQYTQVLSKMPLITVEKIGESDPVPLKASGDLPLSGIRAFGMGHVIAGGAMGRDMALYGADVLNIWRPRDSEVEAFAWDVQVGMRSTILDDSKEDRARFNQLLQDADVFFANKRPGFLKKHDLDASALCAQKPGLIHATVVLHGETGPWSNRPGFDEIGATVSGLFTIEGSPTRPKQPPIVPIVVDPAAQAIVGAYDIVVRPLADEDFVGALDDEVAGHPVDGDVLAVAVERGVPELAGGAQDPRRTPHQPKTGAGDDRDHEEPPSRTRPSGHAGGRLAPLKIGRSPNRFRIFSARDVFFRTKQECPALRKTYE